MDDKNDKCMQLTMPLELFLYCMYKLHFPFYKNIVQYYEYHDN